MMKKMGWKEGGGLGKEGQGITAPLMARKTDKNVAVIEQAPTKAVAPKPTPGTNFNRQPTRVVMLTNMVGKGEIDEDLADETKDEATKYGEIKSVHCVEVPNVRDDQAVRIFICFATPESATKALLGFNGRGCREVRSVQHYCAASRTGECCTFCRTNTVTWTAFCRSGVLRSRK